MLKERVLYVAMIKQHFVWRPSGGGVLLTAKRLPTAKYYFCFLLSKLIHLRSTGREITVKCNTYSPPLH